MGIARKMVFRSAIALSFLPSFGTALLLSSQALCRQRTVASGIARVTMTDAVEDVDSDEEAVASYQPVPSGDSGITKPLGFWDPWGLSKGDNQWGATNRYTFYKDVEIKHGRVAMLAALGFLVAEKFHPLFGGTIDGPSYLAFQQTPLQTFWPIVVAVLAVIEFSTSVPTFEELDKGYWTMKPDHVPGDLGFDPLGWKPKDPEAFKTMQTKEINNGRLAMIGIAGMVAQELVSGTKIFA